MSDTEIGRGIDFVSAEENLLLDFQYLLQELISDKAMSRSDLAHAVGMSKARLSQIFSERANPTLKTCARLVAALKATPEIRAKNCSGPARACPTADWRIDLDEIAATGRRAENDRRFVAAVKESNAASNDNGSQVLLWGIDIYLDCEAA